MVGKHAYMIMAHHRGDLLQKLLNALDDPGNDIYLHIDKKSLRDMNPDSFTTKHSTLKIIPSIPVYWGGYSQIACEMNLIEAAVNDGHHDYYHLLCGASYPLKSQDEIHHFFEDNAGYEFIGFTDGNHQYRTRYYWPFEKHLGDETDSFYKNLIRHLMQIQRKIGVDRFSKHRMDCKKGMAYWSITENLAKYLIGNRSLIKRMMRHTICGDEVFVQTLAYNSPFRDKIRNNNLRYARWGTGKNSCRGQALTTEDIPGMLKTDALFARKLDGNDGSELIRFIQEVKWKQGIKPK